MQSLLKSIQHFRSYGVHKQVLASICQFMSSSDLENYVNVTET